MTVSADPLFENTAWAVHADGLEHKDNGYFIARGQIDDRNSDGLWAWPIHMAEKTWCAPDAFAQAFLQAMAAFGVAGDGQLAASFSAPRLGHDDAPAWRQVARRLGFDEGSHAPIVVEPRRRLPAAGHRVMETYGRAAGVSRPGRGEGQRRTA